MLIFLGSIGSLDPYEDCSLPTESTNSSMWSYVCVALFFLFFGLVLSMFVMSFVMSSKLTPENSQKVTTEQKEL